MRTTRSSQQGDVKRRQAAQSNELNYNKQVHHQRNNKCVQQQITGTTVDGKRETFNNKQRRVT